MKKSFIFAGISILLWSTMATVSKLLLDSMIGMQVLCIGALFAAVFLFLLGLCNGKVRQMRQLSAKDYLKMVIAGLPGTFLYYMFYYIGAARLPASQAFIINYLWPIMSVVFACVLLKEKMTVRKAVAIVLSFLGVVIVTGGDLLHLTVQTGIGIGGCILGAVSYGIFTSLNQKWRYDTQTATMVAFGATFVIALAVNAINGNMFLPQAAQLAGLAFNGVLSFAIPTMCWILALSSGNTAKISNLAYITPFLSLVWTSLLLKEPITVYAVVGLFVIILGIFIQLKDSKKA